MDASEIMSKDVITISHDKNAYEAAKLMKEHDIGALPVVSAGTLIGIVTESDIFKEVTARNMLPEKVAIDSIMSTDLVIVSPDTKIHDINGLLVKHDIRRVIVIENGQIAGIISASDLIRQAYHWTK